MRRLLLLVMLPACIEDSAVWVTLSGDGSGVVTSNPSGISCGGEDPTCAMLVDPSLPVMLTATPASSSRFAGWSGDCSGEGACSLDVAGDARVDARFEIVEHTLAVELAGAGFVLSVPGGISCYPSGGACTHRYTPGTQVTLTAQADGIATAFGAWNGIDGCIDDPTCTFTIDRDVTALASFVPTHELIVTLHGGGSGRVVAPGIDCPGDCSELYPFGREITLDAIAAPGSVFVGWVDGTPTRTRTVTISDMPLALGATFRTLPVLAVTKQGNGMGTVTSSPAGIDCGMTCSQLLQPGSTVTLTATPASGSQFIGWSGACAGTGTCTVTVQSHTNVTATFTLPPTGYGTPNSIMVGNNPTQVEAVDMNLDGKLDLVVANDQSFNVQVHLGNGNATFQAPVTYNLGANPMGIAIGDLDGNGRPDIAVAASLGTVIPLLWTPMNTFQVGTAFDLGSVVPEAIALGDLDNDGKLDAAVTEQTTNTLRVLRGTGNGAFYTQLTFTVGTLPTGVAIGDFNGDGYRDVVTSSYSGGTVSVLINGGNAQLATAVGYATTQPIAHTLSVGDLDGDGKQDLAVANFSAPTQSHVSILRGNGNGTFATAVGYPVGTGAWTATIADVDLDGKPDVLVPCSYSNDVWRLRGNGATLAPATKLISGSEPHDVAVGDFNNDGWPDLAIANGASNTVAIVLAQ